MHSFSFSYTISRISVASDVTSAATRHGTLCLGPSQTKKRKRTRRVQKRVRRNRARIPSLL